MRLSEIIAKIEDKLFKLKNKSIAYLGLPSVKRYFLFLIVAIVVIYWGITASNFYFDDLQVSDNYQESSNNADQRITGDTFKNPTIPEETRKCPTCPQSYWSDCVDYQKTQYGYTCSKFTNYQCEKQNLQVESCLGLDDMKKAIVHVRNDTSGCCDSSGQVSSKLGSSGSGVILFRDNPTNTIWIVTSRHVVDCKFAGSCIYPNDVQITVRTQDGDFHTPSKVLFAPGNLDLAILKIDSPKIAVLRNMQRVMLGEKKFNIGDEIIAIGYPTAGLAAPEPVLEFKISQGKINTIQNLLTFKGVSFEGITSNAITGHGASGGGIFLETGELVGIITWGSVEQKTTMAIDIVTVYNLLNSDESNFNFCPEGTYSTLEGSCCGYGKIHGPDEKCYEPCGNSNTYCAEGSVCCNNQCLLRTTAGYVLGEDCQYHQACGSSTTYCTSGTCCNESCITCPSGYYIATDCQCWPYG